MRSHRRRELNRLGRRLAAELGGELSVTERAGDEACRRHASSSSRRPGWKGRQATAMGSGPAHEAFFRELCHTFADTSPASAAGAFCR